MNWDLLVPALMLIGFLIGLLCAIVYWIGTDIKYELRNRNFWAREEMERASLREKNIEEFERLLQDTSVSRASLCVELQKLKR